MGFSLGGIGKIAKGIANVGLGYATGGWAGAAAGALGYLGQEDVNSASAAASEKQMDFQRQQNQKMMDFQQYNSNTSYQRGVKDMIKAGLNPMLAYSQGGASTPSGTTSQGSQPAFIGNKLQAGVNSALDVAQRTTAVDNTKADTVLKETQARVNSAEEAEIIARTPTYAQGIRLSEHQVQKALQDMDLSRTEVRRLEAEILNIPKEGRKIDSETLLNRAHVRLSDKQVAHFDALMDEIYAGIPQKEVLGDAVRGGRQIVDTIKNGASSAAEVIRDEVPIWSKSFTDWFKPDSSRRNWKPSR